MHAVYTVQVLAQPLLGQVIVLVVKRDEHGPGTWRFPLTRPAWVALGDQAGAYVAEAYTAAHPAEASQLRPGSLGVAIQASRRSAEPAFCSFSPH